MPNSLRVQISWPIRIIHVHQVLLKVMVFVTICYFLWIFWLPCMSIFSLSFLYAPQPKLCLAFDLRKYFSRRGDVAFKIFSYYVSRARLTTALQRRLSLREFFCGEGADVHRLFLASLLCLLYIVGHLPPSASHPGIRLSRGGR